MYLELRSRHIFTVSTNESEEKHSSAYFSAPDNLGNRCVGVKQVCGEVKAAPPQCVLCLQLDHFSMRFTESTFFPPLQTKSISDLQLPYPSVSFPQQIFVSLQQRNWITILHIRCTVCLSWIHTHTHQKIIGVWNIQSSRIFTTFWHFRFKGHGMLPICDPML